MHANGHLEIENLINLVESIPPYVYVLFRLDIAALVVILSLLINIPL